jgi:hypothetical protein
VALDAAAAVFGTGVGLTVNEFALWLHLDDVYWTDQGRKSVDAIFCVLVITGALIGGADFVTGRAGTAAWWTSVAVIAVNLLLCVICLLKGKIVWASYDGVSLTVTAYCLLQRRSREVVRARHTSPSSRVAWERGRHGWFDCSHEVLASHR